MEQHLQISSMERFEYQEKEQGYLFPGGARDAYVLIYVDRGPLHCVADGHDHVLHQGDFVLYSPNQWHMHHAPMGSAPRFVSIVFYLASGDLSPLHNRFLTADTHAATFLRQMLYEKEHPDFWSDDVCISCLQLFLIHSLRNLDAPKEKSRMLYAVNSENAIIYRAQQYITDHVREALSVPLVARKADVSASYLTALFRKRLDISPAEYIRRVKLEKSKQLIREGKMNFTEISAALHYSTVHHFSRQFKANFGMTPTEYAKSVR